MASYFTPRIIFPAAILLRVILLFYGLLQDKYSPVRYTDIDYFVFTDAARYVSRGQSPYQRETYRYTPLLAWLLLPTTWAGEAWFSFGKVIFALADLVAGWLIVQVLKSPVGGAPCLGEERAWKFASIWLLNPMVATISTRGSSEGLVCVMTVALLWAVSQDRIALSGVLLGLAVHFKIYPFIYGASILWHLAPSTSRLEKNENDRPATLAQKLIRFATPARMTFACTAFATFLTLNLLMYSIYATPFLTHTFWYHLTRIDHRHNFSPYNTLLHLSSAAAEPGNFHFESLAFIPQLGLSAIAIPLVVAKRDLAGAMLAQSIAFVVFNKVCTSQYFLWYFILLPLHLPTSSLLSFPYLGLTALTLWIISQALWLHQAFALEFHGRSTFVPRLYVASLVFFGVNIWILGIVIGDLGRRGKTGSGSRSGKGQRRKGV